MAQYADRDILNGTEVVDGNSYVRCRFANCTLVMRGGPIVMRDCAFGGGIAVRFESEAADWARYFGGLLGHDGLAPLVLQRLRDAAMQDFPSVN